METARALSEARTSERFEKRENWRSKRGYLATAEFAAFVNQEPFQRLVDYIRERLKKLDNVTVLLRGIAPQQLAIAALGSLMHSAIIGRPEPRRSIDIGRAVQGELWAAGLLKNNKKLLGRIAKIPDLAQKTRAARRAGFRSKDWPEKQKLRVGHWVAACCLEALPDIFEVSPGNVIDVRDEARDWIGALRDQLMWSNPVIVPCTEPPKPWTASRDGGFWDERTRLSVTFVRTHHKDTERDVRRAFRYGSMKQHVDGVNALQAVPWQINERVLDALKLYADRLRAAGKLKANESLLASDISTAERLRGAPFWVPLNCDFRGRVNGVPHFHFQREDHVRSLFLFDRGLPIGPDGNLKWLMTYAANLAPKEVVSSSWQSVGFQVQEHDRKSFPGRFIWTLDNWDLIEGTAKLESDRWLDAKKPLAFYAACTELHAARTHGPDYITRLPITFDGTCSGLQHLCAMTRDENGGALVNLRASDIGDRPQDIYSVVAAKVARIVENDEMLRGIEIDRDLMKRPVMTYFYSATRHGMTEQLQEALSGPAEWKLLWRLSGYIIDAIKAAVPRAEGVREFLRAYARALARADEPLRYTTPTGFELVNRYYLPKTERIQLILQGTEIKRTVADDHESVFLRQKAVNGAAPNVVHALDAAHLLRTVKACVGAGIKDVLTVHDCFACLTPQAEQFNAIIREEFVRMYEEHDPLREIRERALASLGPLATGLLPDVPQRGSLDLHEFLKATYAFH